MEERWLDWELIHFSKELKLVVELIKFKDDDSIDEKYFFDIDWNLFLQLIYHHRLYPLIYTILKNK
jgi:hypothetical protein